MGKDDKKIKSSGVDNTFRRTWDKDEFREKAKEREQARAGLALPACSLGNLQRVPWVRLAGRVPRFAPKALTPASPLPALQEDEKNEESALEARKRRRLGERFFFARPQSLVSW